MTTKKKNEGSRVANMATKDMAAMQGFAGEPPTFRTKGSESPVQRHRKRIKKNKHLKHRGFSKSEARFVQESIDEVISEVVRKRGKAWALFDDETGVQVGTYKDRATAWKNQRLRRQQAKQRRQSKHKVAKTSHKVASTKNLVMKPKIGTANRDKAGAKNVIKPLKSIKPLKPGVKQFTRQSRHEAFENTVMSQILKEITE